VKVSSHVHSFVNLVENHFNTKIKCIQFDNGPEFFLKDLFFSKVYYIKQVALKLLNKMVALRENINILSTWLVLYFLNLISQLIFGLMSSNTPFFLLIGFHLRSFKIKPLLNFYLHNHPTLVILEFLVVFIMHPLMLPIVKNLTLAPSVAFS